MNVLRAKTVAALILSTALLTAGCKSNANQNATGTPAAQPGQTAVAPAATGTSGQPQNPGTVAAGSTSAPVAVAPQRAPVAAPVAAPVVYTAPAGTSVVIRTNGAISSKTAQVGDRFTGTLERAIVERGHTIVAAGAAVEGEVIAANQKGRFKGPGDLGITVIDIGHHHVETSEYEKIVKGRGGRSAALIGGGAGLGALIGGLAGHGRGALIGGLAGAGAGTAGAAATGNRSVVIPAETIITLTLRTPISSE